MKKLAFWAALITAGLGLSGCDKVETSGNGDLDGYWHLVEVDTLATGGVCDLGGELRFMAVQFHIVQFYDAENPDNSYVAHFNKEKTSLRIYDFRQHARAKGDLPVEKASELNPFGIQRLDETLTIENLSPTKMTLAGDSLRMKYRKM